MSRHQLHCAFLKKVKENSSGQTLHNQWDHLRRSSIRGNIKIYKDLSLLSDQMKSKEITEKEAGELYKVLNTYIGETMTEHVAFIFLSFMIFCNSISLLAIDHIANRIGILGIITASGLFIGNLGFFGN